jgi:hypothetical protein
MAGGSMLVRYTLGTDGLMMVQIDRRDEVYIPKENGTGQPSIFFFGEETKRTPSTGER